MAERGMRGGGVRVLEVEEERVSTGGRAGRGGEGTGVRGAMR